MAKKQEKKVEVEQPQVEEMVIETPVVKAPKVEAKPEPKKPKWEVKDRIYRLRGNKKPLSRMIKSANVYWFDEEKGYERELKYCQNQRTVFVDEMQGDQRMENIVFSNGMLIIEKEKTVLQKFLSLYHPERDVTFYEEKPAIKAASEVAVSYTHLTLPTNREV